MDSYKPTAKTYGLFAGLDIGTDKISCAIGCLGYEIDSNSEDSGGSTTIRLSGFGQRASKGINIHGITEMETLEDAISNAVFAAEDSAKKNIKEVYVNVPSNLTQSYNIETKLSLSGQVPIQPIHIRKLFSLSKNMPIPDNQHIIHVWPLSYRLDDIENIQNPIGMVGKELSASCHIVTAAKSYVQNLTKCIGACNIDVAGFVTDNYASGLACLVSEEAEMGATLIDIGGKNTQIASFLGGNLVWLTHIPIGSYHITSDIARGLSTTLANAERIKTLYGSIAPSGRESAELVPVTKFGDRFGTTMEQVPRKIILDIIKARADEIFECIIFAMSHIPPSIRNLVSQKIVLTGGACLLHGMAEETSKIFDSNVRIASQVGVSGVDSILQSPSFSVCAGLLHYASQDYIGGSQYYYDKKQLTLWQRISLWINENL